MRSSGEDECGSEAVMRKRQTRIEIQCKFKFGNCRSVFTTEIADSAQGAMRPGIVSVQSDSFLCDLDGPLTVIAGGVGKSIDHLVVVGFSDGGIGRSKLRIDGDRVLEEFARLRQI